MDDDPANEGIVRSKPLKSNGNVARDDDGDDDDDDLRAVTGSGNGHDADGRICAQCNAGPSTNPPSDAPTEVITHNGEVIRLHRECIGHWLKAAQAGRIVASVHVEEIPVRGVLQ